MINSYKILIAVLLSMGTKGLLFGQEQNKKPALVSQAVGAVNNTYSLVQTSIYKDPHRTDPTKPIVTRAQLDILGPNKQNSKPLDVKLETPVPPVTINTYGAPEVVDKIGQLVGSLGTIPVPGQGEASASTITNPKAAIAGKAIQSGAALANVAVKIAEGELTKLYGNQQILVNLLEIIPTRYYTIDQSTGKVDVTDDFKKDFDDYTDLLQKYLAAFGEYRKYENVYTQMSLKLRALDPAGKQTAAWQNVRNYDTKDVQPRLKVKNQLEDQLARMFPLYRIAIMASPSAPGNTCGAAGQGPWELYIIYYLGARQTNQIAVKYCVKNSQDFQRIIIEVVKNSIIQADPKYNLQQFKPGGVRIMGQSNATFGQATGIGQGNFNAPQTEVFNWFTEMVTDPTGDSIDSYLVPFDVYAMRQSLAQQKAAKPDDEVIQELSKGIDDLIALNPRFVKEETAVAKTKEQQNIDSWEKIIQTGLVIAGEVAKTGADIARVVEESSAAKTGTPTETSASTQETKATKIIQASLGLAGEAVKTGADIARIVEESSAGKTGTPTETSTPTQGTKAATSETGPTKTE